MKKDTVEIVELTEKELYKTVQAIIANLFDIPKILHSV